MTSLAPQRGRLPVLQYCPPDQLAIDPSYQRRLDARSIQLITRIARNWDWNLFQPLVVAQRADGSLYVVDGQHRLEAARQRGDVAQLPCVIFTPADTCDEASVFVELNQARRPLTPFALFNAAIAAADREAISLAALLSGAGLSFTGAADINRMKPGQLNNVGSIRKWHARHGDRRTRTVLGAISTAFPSQVLQFGAILFAAIGTVVLEHDDTLSVELLAEILDRPQADWLADFRRRSATDDIGLQAAAIAVLRDACRDVLADDDDAPAAETRDPAIPRSRDPAIPRSRDPAIPRRINLAAAPSSMEQRAADWSPVK